MKIEKAFKLLGEGYSQKETAEVLNVSLSTLEKFINAQKKVHNAKSLFHLAVILCKKKNNLKICEILDPQLLDEEK